MSLTKEIMRKFTFWHKIKHPPRWVRKAEDRWCSKLPVRPYNRRKHFVGKNYIYKIQYGQGAQGECPMMGWYKKKRII